MKEVKHLNVTNLISYYYTNNVKNVKSFLPNYTIDPLEKERSLFELCYGIYS